jgi:hypothetical protein
MTFHRAFRLVVIGFVAFLVVVLALPAYASGDCKGQSCNNGGGGDLTTTVDVDTPINMQSSSNMSSSTSVNDSSRAFGIGMGDVDINDCYRSWSMIGYQDSKPNLLCLARELMAEGKYAEAAELRCAPRAVRKALGGKEECIRKLSQLPVAEARSEPAPQRRNEEDEDRLRETVAEQQELYEELMAKIRHLESKPAPRPVVQREVIERNGLTAEQKAQLREVVK